MASQTRTRDEDFVAHSIDKTGRSFVNRLTTGTGAFNMLGRRRYYYMFSGALVVISLLLMLIRGFNLGIDFAGGTTLTFQPAAGQSFDQAAVTKIFDDAIQGTSDSTKPLADAVQKVGSSIQISSKSLAPDQVAAAKKALAASYHLQTSAISDSAVSQTWGSQISDRAIIAVIVFLILVGIFIWIRYEKRVAAGALVATIHDIVITAGIYAAVHFEVTPSTVIGLLTILGFSLYDTVVVYDKVRENTKGLTSLTRRTYPEAANLAVNQTLMRSINTSLIALLPVAGLLVAGVAILGSGTLKDLSLVLLVGMLVGAYSSIFLAVPLAVDLKLRDPAIKNHTAKVLARRRSEGLSVDADGDPIGRKGADLAAAVRMVESLPGAPAPGQAPKPGAKPVRQAAKAAAKAPARPAVTKFKAGPSTRGAQSPKRSDSPSAPAGSSPLAAGSSPVPTAGAVKPVTSAAKAEPAGSSPLAGGSSPVPIAGAVKPITSAVKAEPAGSSPHAAGSSPVPTAGAVKPVTSAVKAEPAASLTKPSAAAAAAPKVSPSGTTSKSAKSMPVKAARPTGKRGR